MDIVRKERSLASLVSEDLKEFYYGNGFYTCDEKAAPKIKDNREIDMGRVIVRKMEIKKKRNIDRAARRQHKRIKDSDSESDDNCPCCQSSSDSDDEYTSYPRARTEIGLENLIK